VADIQSATAETIARKHDTKKEKEEETARHRATIINKLLCNKVSKYKKHAITLNHIVTENDTV